MKQTYTLLLFLFVALSACKKEDNSPAAKIVGKWYIQKTVDRVFDADGKVTSDLTLTYGANENGYILFNKDKTGQIYINASGTPEVHQFNYDASQANKVILSYKDLDLNTDYQLTNVDNNQIILSIERPLSDQNSVKQRSEIYLIRK
ncbi:hypothetical protein D0C36_06045 [Mucilaginibacter conchicola]|uniref:Lipocalin-like domain-containing protein n=1 Tax=Mucilaginibacter conchicola TaxID=2303333 RepID=A0A372P022_9SPHI|nr:hypothetical protein [Mucilaginibacter conchicola]RFZ95087.1 hypothetical protein D0C36_06045 [Mucilaginibacter conchicola]